MGHSEARAGLRHFDQGSRGLESTAAGSSARSLASRLLDSTDSTSGRRSDAMASSISRLSSADFLTLSSYLNSRPG